MIKISKGFFKSVVCVLAAAGMLNVNTALADSSITAGPVSGDHVSIQRQEADPTKPADSAAQSLPADPTMISNQAENQKPKSPIGPASGREAKTADIPAGDIRAQSNSYLGGASLTLLAPQTQSQNFSCVIQTKAGSVIVVDGGLKEDADHLIQTIQDKGGRVSAWLITHPHSDHIGALTEILNREPIPVQIDHVYYSFLPRELYELGQHMGRMANLDDLLTAFGRLAPEKLHTNLEQGQTVRVDEVLITVMNTPFGCLNNTFNNSSVAYRLDLNGKRILFLGDMGWEAGRNLIAINKPEDLKADVVQMAHHGQDGVEEIVYQIIRPEICLWPTPDWLWDNAIDGQIGTGPWKTLTVRKWMEDLGVQRNLCIKDGDQIL